MQKAIFLISAIAVLAAIALFNVGDNLEAHHKFLFKLWTQTHGKKYLDAAEESFRFKIWKDNFAYVNDHNEKFLAGKETFDLEMNAFADLTNEEFDEIYLIRSFESSANGVEKTSQCTGKQAPTSNLPNEVDWSKKGAVTPIKNQGQCGSCWAFSTTGSLEGEYFRNQSQLLSFSEQQLVDCSHDYGNHGCGGGLMNFSFFYVKDNGITEEKKYPYRGVGGSCHYKQETDKVWTISDCTEVTVDKEINLMASINQQPTSVAIQANHLSFQLYKSGVYNGNCGTNLDHGVLAVGYGSDNGKNYFKVKNSWGASWGMSGYIMIARTGDGKGKCGIQMAASFPNA